MTETEGVSKFRLDYEPAAECSEDLEELNVLRTLLYQLGLIGQNPARYDGYGFGNLSVRSSLNIEHFIISGTQTGKLPELTSKQYVTVENCDISTNHVVARGPVEPSSEALTHAMFYQLRPSLKCVLHAHSPNLWQFGLDHAYPATDKSVEYGTVQMAQEIKRLDQSNAFKNRQVLVMAGHEDGVISFGDSIHEAGLAMLQFYVDVCSKSEA